jgi:TonB family protein
MNLLLDSALKATLILFAAWAASLAMRRASAEARHTLWLAAMLAVAMLPAALLIPQSAIPPAALLVVPASVAAGPAAAARNLPWLFLIWASGAILMLARLMTGILSAARITKSARSIDGILYSNRAAAPMTWGFLRPVVILPAYAAEWTDTERELVIRHEQAHITRHDWLCQILASVITAIFWFHPLMWVANYQLRREAESAVDDFVLASGAAPSDYADRLLDVARRLPSLASPDVVIAMVRKPDLEMRVRSILDPSRRRAGAGIFVRCAIVVAAVALVVPIALTRQKVHAQGKVHTQPRILQKVEPEYTQEAKDAKIEGKVVLGAEISPDGIPQNISVVRSLDPGLDANAVTALSQWRFNPGMKDGEPVTVAVRIEVNFHLQ